MYGDGYQPNQSIESAYPNPYQPANDKKKTIVKIILLVIAIILAVGVVVLILSNISSSGGNNSSEDPGAQQGDGLPEEEKSAPDPLNDLLMEHLDLAPHKGYESTLESIDYSNRSNVLKDIKQTTGAGNFDEAFFLEKYKNRVARFSVMTSDGINYYLEHDCLVLINGSGDYPFSKDGNMIIIYGGKLSERQYNVVFYSVADGQGILHDEILSNEIIYKALKGKEKFYTISINIDE